MNHTEPFMFYTERRLVALTGLRASDLSQLLGHLRDVPGSSIFYHTHHMYLSHHFETPVFSNDFALWVAEALHEEALGEKLAAIDLLSFTSIRELREAIIATIERRIGDNGRRLRECPPGDEFYFCRSKSFIMPTGLTARDPKEFFEVLSRVSNVSFFFHFFEARLRLGRPTNDFSQWLAWRGEEALAKAIDATDPYSMTLNEFKERIMALGGNGR
ncbi:MAG: hypothetical protein HY820_29695 [Acidobacteria bacterium]|nr:hypothetical protein [Acidobacteriota bacterium]